MFTKGRIIFVLCFVLVFVIAVIWGYRKDIKERAANFKGSKKVLLVVLLFFFAFIALIQGLKFI